MTKKTKAGIIAGSCAVVLLGGAVAVLTLTAPKEEEEEPTSTVKEETSRLLYDKNPSDIAKLTVRNENGEYVIERYADDFWTIPDISGQPLDYSLIGNTVSQAATMTAQNVISEAPEDLSIYGLDEPRAVVTVDFDGSSEYTKTLKIGNESPKGKVYYFMEDDSQTVYTVSVNDVSGFFTEEYDNINRVVYPNVVDDNAEDDYDPKKINSITVSRKDIDYDMVVSYDERQDLPDAVVGNTSSHRLTEPVVLDLNPDQCDDYLNNVFGLTADTVACISPTEADLETYGLADPFATVDFDINAGPCRLTIGNKVNNEDGSPLGYFAMADGIDIVYVFGTAKLPWAYRVPTDITTTLITSTYIYQINSITIESEGETSVFELKSEDSKLTDVKLNGNDFAEKDKFKSFYQYILKAPAEEIYLEETNDSPRVKLTISTDYYDDVVEFITSGDRMTVIKLNGRTSYRCRTAYVDRLVENIKKMSTGEALIESW